VRIIDISMPISEGMLVFPGDPAPRFERHSTVAEGKMNVTRLILGSHTGTHVDAPQHVFGQGVGVAGMPLDSFYGPCAVLDLTAAGRVLGADDLRQHDIKPGSIVLLKTRNSLEQYDTFRDDYTHLGEDAARWLADRGPRTLGVDYLSVEGPEAEGRVHELLVGRMTVFEGLCLKDVPPGPYLFCGLPLRLGLDGAPARAVLVGQETDPGGLPDA